jgi:hypothetical protein
VKNFSLPFDGFPQSFLPLSLNYPPFWLSIIGTNNFTLP